MSWRLDKHYLFAQRNEAECCHDECCYADGLSVVMLTVTLLNVIRWNVVTMSVVTLSSLTPGQTLYLITGCVSDEEKKNF
jgi:hypothetical protein